MRTFFLNWAKKVPKQNGTESRTRTGFSQFPLPETGGTVETEILFNSNQGTIQIFSFTF
jgi:hypothetical protein